MPEPVRDAGVQLLQHHSGDGRHIELLGVGERHPDQFHQFGVGPGDTLDAMRDSACIQSEEARIEPPRPAGRCDGTADEAQRAEIGQDLRLGPLNAQQQSSSRSVAPAPVAPTHAPVTAATAAPPIAPPAPANQNGKPSGGMFEDVPATPAVPAEQTTSAPSTTSQRPGSAEIPAAPAAPAVPSTVTEAPAKPAAAPKPPEAVAVNGAGGPAWRWPGKGPLIGSFVAGDQTRQGIDIGGTAGDPVLAAADGEVVYSGNGLLGYGELIIVKHNASFLSAYGHNRKRLVQEGEKIKAGQQIAEMGSSASARDELHFEIRKNGKPVNPIDYLPPR